MVIMESWKISLLSDMILYYDITEGASWQQRLEGEDWLSLLLAAFSLDIVALMVCVE
jgi:hypothetical protein